MTTPEKELIIGIIAVVVLGIADVFILRNAYNKNPNANYIEQLKAKQDSISLLNGQKTRYQLEADSILRRQVTLETEAASDRQALLTQRQLYQATIQQYEKLARYDTIGAADIQRYLSDSLP